MKTQFKSLEIMIIVYSWMTEDSMTMKMYPAKDYF